MAPTPELLALRDVCARLEGAGVAYMRTGSLAMSYYARPRMTRDIDLVVALEAAEAERLSGATWLCCSRGRWTGRTWTSGPPASACMNCRRRREMNDTSPEIEAFLEARYAAMSGSERAFMALQMFETAQQIVLSSLEPGLSERERRRELCRRFYGEELARSAYPEHTK